MYISDELKQALTKYNNLQGVLDVFMRLNNSKTLTAIRDIYTFDGIKQITKGVVYNVIGFCIDERTGYPAYMVLNDDMEEHSISIDELEETMRSIEWEKCPKSGAGAFNYIVPHSTGVDLRGRRYKGCAHYERGKITDVDWLELA